MSPADGGSVKEMHTMTDSRKSLIAFSVALGFGVIAGLAPASAAPVSHLGLTSPVPVIEDAGYRRARKYQQLYAAEDAGPNVNYGYVYPGYRPWMPFHGSIEIQELQRMFPETNWPRSMRY
jgi:hypothetical protein